MDDKKEAPKPAPKPGEKKEEPKAADKKEPPKAAPKPAEKKEEPKKPEEKKEEPKKPAEKKEEVKKPAEKKEEPKKPAEKKEEAKKPAEKKEEPKKPAEKKEEPKKPEEKKEEPKKPAEKKEEVKKPAEKKEEPKKPEEKKDEPKKPATPAQKAEEKKPAEAAKPAEAKPAAGKPADAKPAEAKPAAAKPAEAKPAEAKPAAAKPAEAKPAEAKPAAAKPAEAKPAAAKAEAVKLDPANLPDVDISAEMEANVPVVAAAGGVKAAEKVATTIAETVVKEATAVATKAESAVSSAGPVKVQAGAAPAKAEAGPVKVQPQAGPVKVQPEAGPVKVQPQAGPVKVQPEAGPVKVQPQAGPVKVQSQAGPVKVEAKQEDKEVAAITAKPGEQKDGETEVIMQKTFTEGKPRREFKPIPEEFYNTLFYFSGMGSVIASSLASGVYVPEHTAKKAPSAEVAEESEKVRRRSQCKGRDLVTSARVQCTDLSSELRKLQALLNCLPTFGEGVEPLPVPAPTAAVQPEKAILAHTQLIEEFNVPNSPEHPAAPWHQAPAPPRQLTPEVKKEAEPPKPEATAASDLPGDKSHTDGEIQPIPAPVAQTAPPPAPAAPPAPAPPADGAMMNGPIRPPPGGVMVMPHPPAQVSAFRPPSPQVRTQALSPIQGPPSPRPAPPPPPPPSMQNYLPAVMPAEAPISHVSAPIGHGPPRAKSAEPRPTYIPKVEGIREIGVHTGQVLTSVPNRPWQERYGVGHVQNYKAPDPFGHIEIDSRDAKSWQLSRLRAIEAKGIDLADSAGLVDPHTGTMGTRVMSYDDISSYAPYLVSNRSKQADYNQQLYTAKSAQPFIPHNLKNKPSAQDGYRYQFKETTVQSRTSPVKMVRGPSATKHVVAPGRMEGSPGKSPISHVVAPSQYASVSPHPHVRKQNIYVPESDFGYSDL